MMKLEKEIIVALIAAVGGIIVAIVNVFGNRKKSNKPSEMSERDIKINQKATGSQNTQIGIQITKEKEDDYDAR